MDKKLFFLSYLFDYLMGLHDDDEVRLLLLQIAEHGLTNDIYNSAFYEKVLRTKANECQDLCECLSTYDDSTLAQTTCMIERLIYGISQRRYTPKAARPEDEGSPQPKCPQ